MPLRSRNVYFKILYIIFNNPFTNWVLVLLNIDDLPKELLNHNDWKKRTYNEEMSLLENAGYSEIPEIQKLVDTSKAKLIEFVKKNIDEQKAILDIGFGTGLFLKEIEQYRFYLYGIDMNRQFVTRSEGYLPKAHLFLGNYLQFKAPKKFKLIFSISMLMYLEPSRIKKFFNKLYDDLDPNGYVFIQYPHALSFKDLLYPDITYVRYSPKQLERFVRGKFNVIKSEHFYDGRKIGWFDNNHYYFPNSKIRTDTVENTSILVLQKKPTD